MKPPRPTLFDFHGVPMTHIFTDDWENIKHFQARPDDILIATYPKAGLCNLTVEIVTFSRFSVEYWSSLTTSIKSHHYFSIIVLALIDISISLSSSFFQEPHGSPTFLIFCIFLRQGQIVRLPCLFMREYLSWRIRNQIILPVRFWLFWGSVLWWRKCNALFQFLFHCYVPVTCHYGKTYLK